nr:hypothetical protein [uncultured Flavobacterium sp.]
MITDLEQSKIESILFHIVPKALRPVQFYDATQEFRADVIIGLPSKQRGFYDVLYMDIENITPWQLKTFDRRVKKELPAKAFTEQYGNITRLGFK